MAQHADGDVSDGWLTLADRLVSALTAEEVLEVVSTLAAPLLGASLVTISVLDDDGDTLRLVASQGTVAGIPARFASYPVDAPLPARDALATGQPVAFRDRADMDARYPALADVPRGREASYATLPLVGRRGAVGVVTFGWREPQTFAPRQLRTLSGVGRLCAAALERSAVHAAAQAALSDSQTTAETLQRALLPEVADVTGWELATLYRPAVTGTHVGGDWFDAFQLPSGLVGLVVGDVAGKGTRAAAVMGSVRSALRAFASLEPEPALVLDRLDRYVTTFKRDELVTCLYALLDPATGSVCWSSAGHPPALLLTGPMDGDATVDGGSDGVRATWLDDVVDPPLGAGAQGRRAQSRTELPAGTVLVLYSDGLVERRHEHLDVGLDALAAAAGALLAVPDLTSGVETLAAGLDHPDGTGDDLAVLALRRAPHPGGAGG